MQVGALIGQFNVNLEAGTDAGDDMIGIYVKHNDVDTALRILKKKVQKAGLLRELRRRRHYEKPSERRRRQKREGIKNARKRLLTLR